MKRTSTSSKRIDAKRRQAARDAAAETPVPDRDNPPTTERDWDDAIVSRSLSDLHEQLAARRTRGPGKRLAKQQLTLRVPPDVLARWKASGPGWQTRMVDTLADRAP